MSDETTPAVVTDPSAAAAETRGFDPELKTIAATNAPAFDVEKTFSRALDLAVKRAGGTAIRNDFVIAVRWASVSPQWSVRVAWAADGPVVLTASGDSLAETLKSLASAYRENLRNERAELLRQANEIEAFLLSSGDE